jgi:hypothetical protein
MEMTPEQKELARHALGLRDGRKVSYRNHFVVGDGGRDFEAWDALAESGLAKKHGPKTPYGGDYCFVLTRAGAIAALNDGERLDPEDFPTHPHEGEE